MILRGRKTRSLPLMLCCKPAVLCGTEMRWVRCCSCLLGCRVGVSLLHLLCLLSVPENTN